MKITAQLCIAATSLLLPHVSGQTLCAAKGVLSGVVEAASNDILCSFAVEPIYGASQVYTANQPAGFDVFARMDGANAATIGLSGSAAMQSKLWADTGMTSEDTTSGGSYYNVQLSTGIHAIVDGYWFSISTPYANYGAGIYCNLGSDEAAVQATIAAVQQTFADCTIDATLLAQVEASSSSSVGSVVSVYEAVLMWDAISSNTTSGAAVSTAITDTTGSLKFMFRPDAVAKGYAGAALSKARAALLFQGDSDGLNGASLIDSPAYGVQITNAGLFTGTGGVVGSRVEGDSTQIFAGIGVAGSGVADDAVARDKDLALIGVAAIDVDSMDEITLRQRRGITTAEAQLAAQTVFEQRLLLTTDTSPGVVVVRDNAGNIRNMYVEDGCERGAPDIALKSSLTSALFGVNSGDFGSTFTQPGQSLFNVEYLFGGLVSFESAEPLFDADGTLIGSIGVSGTGAGQGTANDGVLAKLAAAAVLAFTDPCASQTGYCGTPIEPVVAIDMDSISTYPGEFVSLSQAVGMTDAMASYTISTTQHSCSSVLDASVRVKSFMCTDDAFVGATDLSTRKAYTAQNFKKEANEELQGAQGPGGVLWKVEVTNGGLFTNAGGASLFDESGSVVGSAGCAGVADDAVGVEPAVTLWNDNVEDFAPSSTDDDDDCNDATNIWMGVAIAFMVISALLVAALVWMHQKVRSSGAQDVKLLG